MRVMAADSCGSGRDSFRLCRVSSFCWMSASMASTSSTPVWKGTSVSTTRGGQTFLAARNAAAAAASAAARAHSRYTGSTAHSTTNTSAAA